MEVFDEHDVAAPLVYLRIQQPFTIRRDAQTPL